MNDIQKSNDKLIDQYKIERICKPSIDPNQLVLKTVDNTESVYSRTMLELRDASLPDTVLRPIEQQGQSPKVVSWDLYLMLKYRQDWQPSGYGLGELVHTMSLLPNEELTLEVKTWETSKTQQDTEKNLDQENVSDIKMTSSIINEATTEDKRKSHEYVDGKAGYSGFGASVSVAAGYSRDLSNFQKDYAKEAQEQSEQVTNKYRATRKVRMAISRESGSESKTTRKIRNINQAHTLNVNFFEILREYEVELHLYGVTLVLLGEEVNLKAGTGYTAIDGSGKQTLKLGEVIQLSSSAANIEALTQQEGTSPIKVIRNAWSRSLYNAAIPGSDWTKSTIKYEKRIEFQKRVLESVRPAPGWMTPDSEGVYRWAYEIIPSKEKDLLSYLYSFLPFSYSQVVGTALLADMQPKVAYVAAVAQYTEAIVPDYEEVLSGVSLASDVAELLQQAADLQVEETDEIVAPGYFHGMGIESYKAFIPEWVQKILDPLEEFSETVGQVGEWKTVLPTEGVHADLSLGICSGAEDYYEVQRQFDLELKKLEVEKLRLEVRKLQLENKALAQGKPDVLIKNPTEKTALNLNITASESPLQVDIENEEQ